MLIIDGFRAGPRTESQMTRPTGRCDRDLGSGLSSAGPSRGTRGVKHDAASGRRDQCHAAMQGSARISGSPSPFPTSPNEGRAARRGPTGPCSTIRVLERCARPPVRCWPIGCHGCPAQAPRSPLSPAPRQDAVRVVYRPASAVRTHVRAGRRRAWGRDLSRVSDGPRAREPSVHMPMGKGRRGSHAAVSERCKQA